MGDRQTVSEEAELVSDLEARAALEAENALLQFDRVLDLIDIAVRDGQPFRLKPSTILMLHAEAMRGVHRQAGGTQLEAVLAAATTPGTGTAADARKFH
jgi:hypothetical protein